jgi:GNAT superfamily N-acetyltransferase
LIVAIFVFLHSFGMMGSQSASNGNSESSQMNGPTINGEQTTIDLYEYAQLCSYSFHPELQELINLAYTHDIEIYPGPRLKSPQQILDELGPASFTYIVSSAAAQDSEKPRLYATISGRRAEVTGPDGLSPEKIWKQPFNEDPDLVEGWEIGLFAVDPKIQRQGLGKLLLGLTETEIGRRFEAGRLSEMKVFEVGDAQEKEGEAKDEGVKAKECHIL